MIHLAAGPPTRQEHAFARLHPRDFREQHERGPSLLQRRLDGVAVEVPQLVGGRRQEDALLAMVGKGVQDFRAEWSQHVVKRYTLNVIRGLIGGRNRSDRGNIVRSFHPRGGACLVGDAVEYETQALSQRRQVAISKPFGQCKEVGRDDGFLVHPREDFSDPRRLPAGVGAGRDRHENVGQGTIGKAAFRALLGHPRLQGLPAVLEVPGTDNHGPDAAELAAVRRLHAEGLALRRRRR